MLEYASTTGLKFDNCELMLTYVTPVYMFNKFGENSSSYLQNAGRFSKTFTADILGYYCVLFNLILTTFQPYRKKDMFFLAKRI
jgi:hypothetical protein